ncbi:DnaJ-like protein [Encephalitozoon hellem ATCC 50504]|uniref:DnaJ domain-containing protein n=1 Tax=Encephalitozoon hellem TaxID=27973 RepID=A0A9Q9C5M8_ENCHE|nr:DnaJ-like protein [Encephalitozoon hellem ATCC 50504]AFM99204.1 DnaJ-like protein [Encephalitozoon hellem ATCC 50504]UTX44190.1 DnaJ domain-containing protein [Encephalitozoon hellem]WEL39681.1 DnaJ domain-containing protein [Encephalitozoon hellem]|eukprot:XP_003888185.1 DnaJ-like protein [Encephalitozoon hellem ATCC 50504]
MNYSEAARSCLSRKDYAGYLENAQKQYELTGSAEDAREVEKARKALSLHKEIEKFLRKDPSDYYDILGVSKDATQPEIKRAFNMLIMKFHPDRTGIHESGAVSGMIQSAYATLGNPEKRRRYDMAREAPTFSRAGPRFTHGDDIMQNVFFNVFHTQGYQGPFTYSNDLYDHLYSQMYRRFTHRRHSTNDPDAQRIFVFLIVIVLILLTM